MYTFLLKKNNAKSTLNGSITNVATSIVVASGAAFPATGNFICTIWDKTTYPDPSDDPNMEIVKVTARSTNTLTVTRAQESTSGVAHASGLNIELLFTKGQLDEWETEINAALDGIVPQTPWASAIDGAGYALSNVGALSTLNNILDDGIGNLLLYDQANAMNFIKMSMEGGVTANMGIHGDNNIGGAYPMQFYLYDNSLGNGDNRVFGMQTQFNGGLDYNKAFTAVNSGGSLATVINFGYDNQVYFGPTDWAQADADVQVDGTFHANDYMSQDGSHGVSTTITSGSLVGKTITVKNGLITSFA